MARELTLPIQTRTQPYQSPSITVTGERDACVVQFTSDAWPASPTATVIAFVLERWTGTAWVQIAGTTFRYGARGADGSLPRFGIGRTGRTLRGDSIRARLAPSASVRFGLTVDVD